MMDSFISLQSFDGYQNMPTIHEEYPDYPFNVATSTVSVAAIVSVLNQTFTGSPLSG